MKIRARDKGIPKIRGSKIPIAQDGKTEVRTEQLGAGHRCIREVCSIQSRFGEVGLAQIGSLEVCIAQIGRAELCIVEAGTFQVRALKIRIRQICARQVCL